MEDVLNLVDEFIKFEKLATKSRDAKASNQTSEASPYYEIIKIYSSQTKNKIKSLLSTIKPKTFYDYMIYQKQKSKAIKPNMPELEFTIDFGKLAIHDINDLKILFMVSYKNSSNATFDITQKQIDLMILNNNNIIKKLSELLLNPTLTENTFEHIEDLIYSLKIKIELYKFIY